MKTARLTMKSKTHGHVAYFVDGKPAKRCIGPGIYADSEVVDTQGFALVAMEREGWRVETVSAPS